MLFWAFYTEKGLFSMFLGLPQTVNKPEGNLREGKYFNLVVSQFKKDFSHSTAIGEASGNYLHFFIIRGFILKSRFVNYSVWPGKFSVP